MALMLERSTGQSIMIGNDVVLTVLEVNGSRVRLGFTAPKDVRVLLEEQHQRLERERIPPFSTHRGRLEQLGRAERDMARSIDTSVSLFGTVGSEGSRLERPLAEIIEELQVENQQRSHKAARRLLEYLKYLRQTLEAQVAILITHGSKAAAITAPFVEAARLYDSSALQKRIQQLNISERHVDAAVTLLRNVIDEASQLEGPLAGSIASRRPNSLRDAQAGSQKMLAVLAGLPRGLQALAADLKTGGSKQETLPAKNLATHRG